MEILVTAQSARSLLPLELHNLCKSEGKRLTGVHLGHQLGWEGSGTVRERRWPPRAGLHREQEPPEPGRSLFRLLPSCSCNVTKDGCFSSRKTLDGNLADVWTWISCRIMQPCQGNPWVCSQCSWGPWHLSSRGSPPVPREEMALQQGLQGVRLIPAQAGNSPVYPYLCLLWKEAWGD